MLNLLSTIISIFGTGHSSSFFCSFASFFNMIGDLVGRILNFFAGIFWEVMKFLLGLLEALEYMISNFLGIVYDSNKGAYKSIDAEQIIEFGKAQGFFDTIVSVFKALLISSIILVVIFTIYAIIKQEIANAQGGFEKSKSGKPKNEVMPVVMAAGKHILMMALIPFIMIFLLQGVNSVLASFRNAFSAASGTTIAGQVLASSTYDANKYRTYANANQRIPIIIETYNPDDFKDDEKAKLLATIKQISVQNKLKNVATNLAYNTFLSFGQSATYENNKLYNSERYESYYEKFVCTREQYQVLADFVDYAQLNGMNYYVKSMDDPSVDWGYVSSTTYNSTDNSLTITYSDGSDFDKDGKTNDVYNLVLAPENKVVSPISDTLDSIMAMLGIGKYGDNVYKEMERDDSGEFLNLVNWAKEKCLLQFSRTFNRYNSLTWSDTDQIIMYEYYHYPENNTLRNYKIEDFEQGVNGKGGVEVPVYQISYKTYIPAIDGYSKTKYINCVLLNGTYYKVELSTQADIQGYPYYKLASLNSNGGGSTVGSSVHLLDPNYSVLEETKDTFTLKFSDDFDLNNPNTWTLSDQIMVYEYYSDLSLSNVFGGYTLSRLESEGIVLPVYNITVSDIVVDEYNRVQDSNPVTKSPYALINGTYYSLVDIDSGAAVKYQIGYNDPNPDEHPDYTVSASDDFLVSSTEAARTNYKYSILTDVLDLGNQTYGYTTKLNTPSSFMLNVSDTTSFKDLTSEDPQFDKYNEAVLQLSLKFDYTDTTTWTYRDYLLFYMYVTHGISNSINTLKHIGVEGDIGTVKAQVLDDNGNTVEATKYCLRTDKKITVTIGSGGGATTVEKPIYFDLESVLNISELKVYEQLDHIETLQKNNLDSYDDNLFYVYDSLFDNLKVIETLSTKFNFSPNFAAQNVATWTVGDFILYYLSNTKVINDYEFLESEGYNALTYDVKNAAGETDVLYAFGKVNKDISADVFDNAKFASFEAQLAKKYENVIYLSRNGVLSLADKDGNDMGISTVANWFNTSLYTYICDYNNFDLSELVTDKNTILASIYENFEQYILDFDELVDQIVTENWTDGIYSNVTNFTYVNSSYNRNDVSTWNNFDTLLYLLDGRMNGVLSTQIVMDSDGAKYIVYAGKAIKISSGTFAMTIVDDLLISCNTENPFDSYVMLSDYYNDNLKQLLATNISALSSVNTMQIVYKPQASFDLNDDSTIASHELNDLDIIIAMNEADRKVETTDEYKVSLYTDGVFTYAKFGNVYVKVHDKDSTGDRVSSVEFKMSATMSYTSTSPFTKTGDVYSAFAHNHTEDADGDYVLNDDITQIKPLDALIYSVTQSNAVTDYQIYTFDDGDPATDNKQYIQVKNPKTSTFVFIEYQMAGVGNQNSVATDIETSFDSNGTGVSIDNELKYIDYLYNQYYSVNFMTSISSLSAQNEPVKFKISFEAANPETWTPLGIILFKNGYIETSVTNKEFAGVIVHSQDGSKSYLKLEIDSSSSSGMASAVYINITKICDINDGYEEGFIGLSFNNAENYIMYLRAYEIRGNSNVCQDNKNLVLNQYKTLESKMRARYDEVVNSSKLPYDLCVEKSAQFELNDVTTWTWFDLIYYQYNGEIRTQEKFWIYYSETNGTEKTFIQIQNQDEFIYLEYIPEFINKNFIDTNVRIDADYDEQNFTMFSLIVNSLTEKVENSVPVYQYQYDLAGNTKIFYYVQKKSNGVYYGIYGITPNTDTFGFEYALAKKVKYSKPGENIIETEIPIINPNDYFVLDENLPEPDSYLDRNTLGIDYYKYARVYYTINSFENLTDWTVADLIFAYAAGSIGLENEMNLVSKLLRFNNKYYFVVDDVYINLSLISDASISNKCFINFDYTQGTLYYLLNETTNLNPIKNEVIEGIGIKKAFAGLSNDEKEDIVKYDETDVSVELLYNEFKNGSSAAKVELEKTSTVFKFSPKFNPSDFSTWTYADFVLYYVIAEGFYVPEKVIDPDVTNMGLNFKFNKKIYSLDDPEVVAGNIEQIYSSTNFQTFVENGGVPAYIYHLTKTDAFGNVTTTKVINFSNAYMSATGAYVNYNVFDSLYNRKMAAPVLVQTQPIANLEFISNGDAADLELGDYNICYTINSTEIIVDLEYKNYFYFEGQAPKYIELFKLDNNVSIDKQSEILSGQSETYKPVGFIQLKLSAGFSTDVTDENNKINKPNEWTLLDYIYLYEYARGASNLNFGYDENDNLVIQENVASNVFYGLTFENLVNGGNYIDVYSDDEGNDKFIALNGTVYNVAPYVRQVDTTNIDFLKNFNDKINSYITNNETGNVIAKLSDLSTLGAAHRFSNVFATQIKAYIATTGADLGPEKAVDKMKEICVQFINHPPTGAINDDILLADYLYGRLVQYAANSKVENKTLADFLKVILENRIEYLNNNSEYAEKTGITVNNYTFESGHVSFGSATGEIVKKGTDAKSDFRVLVSTHQYALNTEIRFMTNANGKKVARLISNIGTLPDTISYEIPLNLGVDDTDDPIMQTPESERDKLNWKKVFRNVYQNTKQAYQISLTTFATYDIYELVKEVSWPQKLMNDMQVLYPDLNWETLVATEGWLDTLGEFTSAYTNGTYVSTGNSSNTTAAGLVLSEFFLTKAKYVSGSYANYEYSSLFDEKVLNSLMLAILGEEEYATLSLQAEVFMELFNVSFAPILDDIAYEKAINIADGQVDNFVMCVYKSYLATALLSSDIGEYLYTVATRVYAGYTIHESLAQSAGDYSRYYGYLNGQYDSNGEVINAFTYGSFEELVEYENELSGNATPVFTFSMYKAYCKYITENKGKDNKLIVYDDSIPPVEKEFSSTSKKYDAVLETYGFSRTFAVLSDYVWKYYDQAYQAKTKIEDRDPLYCFMYETYFEIRKECRGKEENHPIYLKQYKAYLNGSIKRWEIVKEVSTVSTTSLIPYYGKYKAARSMSMMMMTVDYLKLAYGKSVVDDGVTEDQNAFEKFLNKLNFFDDVRVSHTDVLLDSFGTEYDNYVNFVYPKASLGSLFDLIFGFYTELNDCANGEPGYMRTWNKLLKMQEYIPYIIEEINQVAILDTDTERTEMGSRKVQETFVYEEILDNLVEFQNYLEAFIAAQQKIDQISKTSITFALSEYGQNYVPSGYDFTVDGKTYTFKSDVSALRLAEYVFGGSYLLEFGIEPYYTSADYNGIVQASKVYNPETGHVQTKLNCWKQLREFAGQIANYTSKLYYTSNLVDVAANKNDAVKLDSYIFGHVSHNGSNELMKTTPEYMILRYLIEEEAITPETFVSLIFGDTKSSLRDPVNEDAFRANVPLSVQQLAKYINGETLDGINTADEWAEFFEKAVLDYLYYIQTDDYTSGYYNPTGNTTELSQRIHMAFKNVISYLLVSEEQEETVAENPIVLDDITIIEFKHLLMEKIVDYQQNPSETAAENSNRYIALFNLITCEFDYYKAIGDLPSVTRTEYLSTQITTSQMSPDVDEVDGMLLLADGSTKLYAEYGIGKSTRNLVLKLAGLENRPIEELVNLEYDNLYNRNGFYDEAMGDVFVICTMDEVSGKYVPIMARGKNVSRYAHEVADTLYGRYVTKYSIDIQTAAYNNDASIVTEGRNSPEELTAYPIIAKGIITNDGLPTAIRTIDGEVYYYRTNIVMLSELNDEAVGATSALSEVTTLGYTKYVQATAFKRVTHGANRAMMFSSGSDMRTTLESNLDAAFAQESIRYGSIKSDDYGALNVLDSFQYYYTFGGQTYILLLIGISTMLPILFNASGSIVRRVLDILLLSFISPVIIATKQLDPTGESKGGMSKAFDTWKQMMTKALLSAFGYIVAFNAYYILIKVTLSMDFISDYSFEKIRALGGLGFLTKGLLDAVLRAMWVIAAASFVKGAASLFTELLTMEANANPFASAIGGAEPMTQIKSMASEAYAKVKAVKKMAESVKSGEAFVDLKNYVAEQLKTFIPGSAVIGSAVEMGRKMKDKSDAKKIREQAIKAGVDEATAKKFEKDYVAKQAANRQKERQNKIDSANKFSKTFMGGDGKEFSNLSPSTMDQLASGAYFKNLHTERMLNPDNKDENGIVKSNWGITMSGFSTEKNKQKLEELNPSKKKKKKKK